MLTVVATLSLPPSLFFSLSQAWQAEMGRLSEQLQGLGRLGEELITACGDTEKPPITKSLEEVESVRGGGGGGIIILLKFMSLVIFHLHGAPWKYGIKFHFVYQLVFSPLFEGFSPTRSKCLVYKALHGPAPSDLTNLITLYTRAHTVPSHYTQYTSTHLTLPRFQTSRSPEILKNSWGPSIPIPCPYL